MSSAGGCCPGLMTADYLGGGMNRLVAAKAAAPSALS